MLSFSCSNPEKPNILLVLADDMGYSDIGCYGGEIITPNLDEYVLAGITRNFILNILPEVGLRFQEKDINLKDLPEFNEAFITNSLIEVLPVVSLGKITFTIKKVSHLLHGSYKKKVEEAKKFSLN